MASRDKYPSSPELGPNATWGGVTDPTHHDPAHFRYLVHAIAPDAKLNQKVLALTGFNKGQTQDLEAGDQSIDLCLQPARLNERVSLSMSLISPSHLDTWAPAGLIVNAPAESIVWAGPEDSGTLSADISLLRWQAGNQVIQDPDEVLRQSSPGIYNEVVALGKTSPQPLQLAGFFYKVRDGEVYDPVVTTFLQSRAKELDLPMVAIEDPGLYAEDRVDVSDEWLMVNQDGYRYVLQAPERYKGSYFAAEDGVNAALFADPQKMCSLLDYAVASGKVTADQAAEVMETYIRADEARQTPQVSFDEDGTFENISFEKGYGRDAQRTLVFSDGTTARYTIKVHDEQTRRSLITGAGTTASFSVPPPQVDGIVEAACAQLPLEKAEVVRAWHTATKATILQNWQNQRRNCDLSGGFLFFADAQNGSVARGGKTRSALPSADLEFTWHEEWY